MVETRRIAGLIKAIIPGIRAEVLNKFTAPRLLISSSSMLDIMNSAEKVEAVAGNITATSQEMTIIGGSATATGDSWVYWNLPISATKVYVRAKLMVPTGSKSGSIDLCEQSGDLARFAAGLDFYEIRLQPENATQDLQLVKWLGATGSIVAYEAVDLSYDTFYDYEVYIDMNNAWIWRDGVLKINGVAIDPTNIPSISSIALRCHDGSTAAAQEAHFRGQVVIIYE
jgi:hypothetical protein